MKSRFLLTSAVVLWSLSVVAGPVFIDGGDRDDHGSFNGTSNLDGWKYIEQAVNFLYTNASNGGTGILVIGASGTALAAANSAASKLGLPVPTVVTGAAITSANFATFRIIYVPSDAGNTGGGISDADLALLTARKSDIQAFVNAGGGLFALTEAGAASPYAWLALPAPFTITTTFSNDTNAQTAALAAAGFSITDTELNNGTPTHNRFTGPAGFNGLTVFVVDGTGGVISLGGGATTVLGASTVVPTLSEWSLILMAGLVGLWGVVMLRNRRLG